MQNLDPPTYGLVGPVYTAAFSCIFVPFSAFLAENMRKPSASMVKKFEMKLKIF